MCGGCLQERASEGLGKGRLPAGCHTSPHRQQGSTRGGGNAWAAPLPRHPPAPPGRVSRSSRQTSWGTAAAASPQRCASCSESRCAQRRGRGGTRARAWSSALPAAPAVALPLSPALPPCNALRPGRPAPRAPPLQEQAAGGDPDTLDPRGDLKISDLSLTQQLGELAAARAARAALRCHACPGTAPQFALVRSEALLRRRVDALAHDLSDASLQQV